MLPGKGSGVIRSPRQVLAEFEPGTVQEVHAGYDRERDRQLANQLVRQVPALHGRYMVSDFVNFKNKQSIFFQFQTKITQK